MSGDKKATIVVKRIKKGGHGHHGGAWKIAYADFVTAMMAFFLLMWLLGSTTQGDLQGIAEYFKTPLKVALAGGSGSGDSSSVIKGGGKDLTRSTGQLQKSDTPHGKKTINLIEAAAILERQEGQRLADLKSKLDAAIEANASLQPYKKQIQVDITPDGLRVQIVDEHNRPMFDSGSAVVKPYMRELLQAIGSVLTEVPNRLTLEGHTDSQPYSGGERGYSNWELSADRANASRRELVSGGIDEKKIIRIVGLGASVMLDKADPYDPINRRIAILVLNHKAEKRVLEETITPDNPADPSTAPDAGATPVSVETSGSAAAASAVPQGAQGTPHSEGAAAAK